MRSTNTGAGDTGRDPSAWDELTFGCSVLVLFGPFIIGALVLVAAAFGAREPEDARQDPIATGLGPERGLGADLPGRSPPDEQ